MKKLKKIVLKGKVKDELTQFCECKGPKKTFGEQTTEYCLKCYKLISPKPDREKMREKIKTIMTEAFEDQLDEQAPKQPYGSKERYFGLLLGSTIIAKSLDKIMEIIEG